MEKLITDLMSNKITLTTFIKECKNITSFDEEKAIKALDVYQDEDRSAIVFLILYYIYKYRFTKQSPFISFLESIEDEIDNDFDKDCLFHYLNENITIFQIDHLYFIINNNEDSFSVTLPTNLQNDYQFCVNCNHDLYFEEQLQLESYEFYIISDIK